MMTGISGEKLISQQVKAFLVAARKRTFCSELHLFDDEVMLKSRGSMDRSTRCINFLGRFHFFSPLLFHYRRHRWSVNVADSKERDDRAENNATRQLYPPPRCRYDIFRYKNPHYPNLHWHEKHIIQKLFWLLRVKNWLIFTNRHYSHIASYNLA